MVGNGTELPGQLNTGANAKTNKFVSYRQNTGASAKTNKHV